ncbi:nuclear transport factor 2 family protein [Aggregicoccus sp. 17bor-14]|uniref:nuclear transport factor 2 family protein n=1 Tax=Myxococcaceae TaxID=31 RepID=UPI00129C8931|nr:MULTISPECIES: nuclear transport factor 2 family protein [Myxococcaceae]MBF5044846.1 nuclear transport factor 2 family protein [Simulacricoccus sp. 17bor-14]MRI90590.1 nuclear transport factor 2 family protein [Aggregicoccus sp. 17bor-14]
MSAESASHDDGGARNRALARAWLRAFNTYDVPALVALYADDCTHTSPKIRALHPDTGGKLVGKEALARWWNEANARLPGLRYEETALTADGERVFMEYLRHAPGGEPPMPVAEVLEIRNGRIVASRVYHG